MDQLRRVEADLAAAMTRPADHPGLHPLLERHRALMARFWGKPCDAAAYAGLADLYRAHDGFAAHFDAVAPGLATWLPQAMVAHAARVGQG